MSVLYQMWKWSGKIGFNVIKCKFLREGRWVGVDMWVSTCVCVCVWFCAFVLSARLREALQMLKLCACKEQLFHPPLYLSHAQKVLAQTVMVPRPYLRFPWRFLHPQVGNPHASSTCPRMCHSFSHHTHITCWFGVCHHVSFALISLWEVWNCTCLV